MKVLLFQLPVPNNPQANVPLALGYLKAYAAAQGLLNACTIDILPRSIVDRGGDAMIIAAVLERQPDVLGVSLYTWNSERTLHLLQRIKAALPDLWIVVGGPEVQADNRWVLEHPAVDLAVLGEGEQTFADLLRWRLEQRPAWTATLPLSASPSMPQPATLETIPGLALQRDGNILITPPRTGLPDLAVIPSPFLAGYLEIGPDDIAFIECSRWCPYRCTFCLYGRNMGSKLGNRLFPVERVAAEVAWAQAQGVTTIHFVEANLNLLPYFRPLMARLQALNADHRLRFYAELRGEHLSTEAVDLLVDAGLYAAEVGLQSANPVALQAVERRTDLGKWAAGTRRLYHQKIEVLLDVILGLPGDDPTGVAYTLDWLTQEDLGPYDVFMLQVLPGTIVRERAALHGLRHQDRPPYYILANNELSYTELRGLRWELKERAGFDPTAIEGMPELVINRTSHHPQQTPITSLYLDPSSLACPLSSLSPQSSVLSPPPPPLASHVTLYVAQWDAAALRAAIWPLAEQNLTIHWDVVVQGEPPAPAAIRELHAAWPHTIGYLDRVGVYQRVVPEPAYRKVTPRWTLLVAWGHPVDPLAYEGLAHIVWHVQAECIKPLLPQIEAYGGLGLLITGGDQALQAEIATWQQTSGWHVWWETNQQ